MRSKIFKPSILALIALFAINASGFAQKKTRAKQKHVVTITTNFDEADFQAKMDNLGKSLEAGMKDLGKNISSTVNNLASNISVSVNNSDNDDDVSVEPKVELNLGNLLNKIDINVSDNEDESENDNQTLKVKNFSKSYPLDANDRIRLSNQYGKITVNTWDRHEVKVDVQIKAEARNDDDAQKLIDGVQISDSKNGDQVSFKTNISRDDDGFWSLFNFGGRNKKQKLTINYVVYMPAKTDLNVEASYGSIELPDLDGRVKISTSYGSTSVQNLSNPSNEIEGSYGSIKIGSINGGRLDFSYGSVDIEECNNLKADLSYGSFKIGRLKGSGDFDLSYEGGFKIAEVASSLRRLNINSSYSGASIGISPASNFDFDITTSYGGFNYNDNNVFITSKNPPDGSKHIGTTRNYKGRVGKGSSEARVTINTSYGGVHFD
ncbi:DUF4097 family beta strand repeat-containing protein [Mucilaginibacter xinganensis]|uniref:Adhesin domain-containing protein n=1 Tax=Mucilaginibacter xinganensis TaxID=1234841 RepID=A0A223NR70_9SPHI|nr:hypothetical protein [Mucilaginibacter xinganensis]ASU32402.1 hypothetical protein MuYL_0499 [Mucilaginibacter xinganensis]